MNLTFTSNEFSELMNQLEDWYNRRSIFVLENMQHDLLMGNPKEVVHRLLQRFEIEHPKPDWKSLL